MTHPLLVRADIFGELYVQCQYIISLKDSNWCPKNWSEDLETYWAIPNGSSYLNIYDLINVTSYTIYILPTLQDYCFLHYQMCD